MGKNSLRTKALATFEKCEDDWIKSLGESAQQYYPAYWQCFKDFAGLKGSELLDQRINDFKLREDDKGHWRIEELALKYYKSLYRNRDPPIPKGTDAMKLTVVQSFFAYHRIPLVFRKGEAEEAITTEKYYEYSLKDLESAKRHGNAKERWIFFGGKSLGQRINDFLRIKRLSVESLLGETPPTPIDIPTTKRNLIAHPCLDADAVEAAKDYLATRTDSNPYMLPSQNSADNKKMTGKAVAEAIKRVADIAHRADPTVFKYRERGERLRFHNLRVFLNSGLQNARIDPDLRDWMVGHKLSGTKKAYTSHQREQAYREAEAYLLLPRHEQLDQRVQALEDLMSPELKEKFKAGGFTISDQNTGRRLLKHEYSEKEKEAMMKKVRKERKVVSEDEIENCLNHGWNPVIALSSGKILIERDLEE